MPTNAENIDTAIAILITKIAAESAITRPNYSIHGQSVSREGFLASLLKQLKELQELKGSIDGPWEIEVTG